MAAEMGVLPSPRSSPRSTLAEFNPMLGHRAAVWQHLPPRSPRCRPVIIEAAMNVKASGMPAAVEIMVPLVGNHKGAALPEEHHRRYGRAGILGAQRQDRLHGRYDDRGSARRRA